MKYWTWTSVLSVLIVAAILAGCDKREPAQKPEAYDPKVTGVPIYPPVPPDESLVDPSKIKKAAPAPAPIEKPAPAPATGPASEPATTAPADSTPAAETP
jgi:hypothetical protein